jgi:hypothetical protein
LSEFLKSPDATHSKIYPEEALMQWRKLKWAFQIQKNLRSTSKKHSTL